MSKKNKRHPSSEHQRRWAFSEELPRGKAHAWSRRVEGEDLPAKTSALKEIAEAAFQDELQKILTS